MVQKLLVMERDTQEELQQDIRKHFLEIGAGMRISALSVLKGLSGYQAWVVLEFPDKKEGLHYANDEPVMGMTE